MFCGNEQSECENSGDSIRVNINESDKENKIVKLFTYDTIGQQRVWIKDSIQFRSDKTELGVSFEFERMYAQLGKSAYFALDNIHVFKIDYEKPATTTTERTSTATTTSSIEKPDLTTISDEKEEELHTTIEKTDEATTTTTVSPQSTKPTEKPKKKIDLDLKFNINFEVKLKL